MTTAETQAAGIAVVVTLYAAPISSTDHELPYEDHSLR